MLDPIEGEIHNIAMINVPVIKVLTLVGFILTSYCTYSIYIHLNYIKKNT